MIVKGNKVELNHRAFFLRGAQRQPIFLAASIQGRISLVDSALGVIPLGQLPFFLGDVSPHPSRHLIALVGEYTGELLITDFNGQVLFEQKLPEPEDIGSGNIGPRFEACLFDEDEKYLWCARTISNDEVEIQLRAIADWAVVYRERIIDPYGRSSCSFHRTTLSNTVTLWLAAGQDGQQIYWLNREQDRFTCMREPLLVDTTPPDFAPNGREFLVTKELENISRFSFPTVRQLGEFRWPRPETEHLFDRAVYLDDKVALVSSSEGLVCLLSLRAMTKLEDVIIEGHEPKPIEEVYPNQPGEKGLCTRLLYFERVGDNIIFVFQRDWSGKSENWSDELILVPVSDFLNGSTA